MILFSRCPGMRRGISLLTLFVLLAATLCIPATVSAESLSFVAGDGVSFRQYSTRLDLKRAYYTMNINGGTRPYSFSFSKPGIVSIEPDYPGAQVAFKVIPKAVGTTILKVTDKDGKNSINRELVVYDPGAQPLALNGLPDAANPVAVGQGRSFTVSGGKAPYTIVSANPGIARVEIKQSGFHILWGVAAGTTQITATDATGAKVQGTAHIGTTKPLIVSANDTLLTGGKGELIINSGNPPYTVTTNANVTAALKGTDSYGRTVYTLTTIAPGQGTVTVKDSKGQTATKIVTVKDTVTLSFPQLTGDLRTIDVGQTTKLVVTGGTAPYTVTADNPATVAIVQQSAGQYTVTGRQAGVVGIIAKDASGATRTLSLTVRALPTLTVAAPEKLLLGSTGTLTLIGGVSPFTVTVSGPQLTVTKLDDKKYTLTPKLPGKATITVRDAKGTTVQKTVTVEAPALKLELGSATLETGQSGVLDVKGGVGPYTVTLSNSSASVKLQSTQPAYTRYEITGVTPGTVTVTVKDSLGAIVTASLTITTEKLRMLLSSPTLKLAATGSAAIRVLTVQGGAAPYSATVSAPSVATLVKVSATQFQITPRAKGTAVITVKDAKGATVSQTITVE